MVPLNPPRTVALCYIRVSLAPKGQYSRSADRQRANIEAVCIANDWIPEWFEDVGGHRSGTSNKHRPEWAKLWQRLSETDVVAVVTNDLSRLYRKGELLGTFLRMLRIQDIRLVLADPRKNFNPLDDNNREMVRRIAQQDEEYAQDVREHILGSVDYRFAMGIHQGAIPFGTERNANGQLLPSTQGAWLLSDGSYVAGKSTDLVPDAVQWYGFYDALLAMYQIFTYQGYSQDKIARQLNKMGYRYRDRQNRIAPFERDDVRRILANWPEYGGYRGGGDARRDDRHAINKPPEDYQLNIGLAVLPLHLIKEVGLKRHETSHRKSDVTIKRTSQNYVLSALIRCAHCHNRFLKTGNPNDLTYLWGHNKSGAKKPIYVHKDQTCTVKKKSVQQEKVHSKFLQLVHTLIADSKPLSNQEEIGSFYREEKNRLEKAIAHVNVMYAAGMITFTIAQEQLQKFKKEQKRLRSLQDQDLKTQAELGAVELQEILHKWDSSADDERHELVTHVFEWITYDLDTEEITEFKLTKNADGYLAALVRQKSAK